MALEDFLQAYVSSLHVQIFIIVTSIYFYKYSFNYFNMVKLQTCYYFIVTIA